jgi:ubiquinone/menaquinone biosynthesis C-methylase UbiE
LSQEKYDVTGIEIKEEALNIIKTNYPANNLTLVQGDIFKMDFPDESFDIIWAEGSISIIGFEQGLKKWRRLLRPGGFLVVHAQTRKLSNKLEKMPDWGYKLLNIASIPEDAHWKEYYKPLEPRIKDLQAKYRNNPEALRILRKYQNEIDMVKRNPQKFSSAFYLMQKL